jgi:DnaK suppressor protein
MISEATRAELRVRLEAELARLEADFAAPDSAERDALSEAGGENAYRDHMADQGSATFEREMDMTFEENERDEIERVRAALTRLEAGTYGVCARCSKEIPAARLEAVPAASLCVQCKSAEEAR